MGAGRIAAWSLVGVSQVLSRHGLHLQAAGRDRHLPHIELPLTDHAFNHVLNSMSPPGVDALFYSERFLAVLATEPG